MDKARLGRSRRDSRVFNSDQQLTEFGTQNRSLASRLGMPDMSCFPGTRARRPNSSNTSSASSSSSGNMTDVYELSKSSSQRRREYVGSGSTSTSTSLLDRSRSLERGKGQIYAQGVYLRDNELAVEEEARNLEAEENENQLSEGSDSDDVFELRHMGSPYPGSERVQTYRSPTSLDAGSSSSSSSLLRSKRKCCPQTVKSSISSSQPSSPTIFNSRRVFMGSSSSSSASAATSSSSRASLTGSVGEVAVGQKPRLPRNTSSLRACSSVRPGTAVPMEQDQADRSLNSRRLGSLMNSSSDSREMRLRLRTPSTGGLSAPPPPSIRSSISSRGSPPLGSLRSTVSSRLHQVENTEVPAYSNSRRTGIRRTNAASSLLPGDRYHGRQQSSSSSNLFTRRNISHCFPAFGGNSGRRSSSPLLREASQASGYRHFHGADEGYHQADSASSSSPSTSSASPGPLSLLAAALEMMPSSSGGYQGSGREQQQQQSPSDAMASHEQNWGSSFGWEYHRPRLMAEGLAKVLMALERMENDDDLTHEQLLMLEATVLFGGMSLHDEHRDWRLDVDNMSYEELLALGDRIGSVNTGLSDEVVSSRLVRSKFSWVSSSGQDSEELKCSICQEEYAHGEELGSIECGHKYHAACISQWLVQKNLCPICKAAAVTN